MRSLHEKILSYKSYSLNNIRNGTNVVLLILTTQLFIENPILYLKVKVKVSV